MNMSEEFIDYYAVLGVDPQASEREIDRAYRDKIKSSHPDKNGGAASAEEHTRRLNRAREVLKDPHTRSRFDAARLTYIFINQRRPPPPPPPRSTPPPRNTRRPRPTSAPHWTPPPPPPPQPVGANPGIDAGAAFGALGAALLVLGGVWLLSKRNRYDHSAERYRGADGTFRSGPFS